MEFKSQICTDINQSRKLLELGLKKDTADCGHFYGRQEHEECEDWETIILDNNWQSYWDVTDKEIPAWSLHRLLLLLDCAYVELDANNPFEDCITRIEFLIKESKIFNKDYLEGK